MNNSSSSFSVSPETTYVAELAIALQTAKKRIQDLENEKHFASNTPGDGIGANQQMAVVNLAGQVLSHNYARLNEVMGEQLSTMHARFLELRSNKAVEDREREQPREGQTLAALQVELANERAANTELTAENEKLKTRTLSAAELREVERESEELSTRCAELQDELAGLQTKYDALPQRRSRRGALEEGWKRLKSTNASLNRKMADLLQVHAEPESEYDSIKKWRAHFVGETAGA
ncbi:hypothetical protein B0H16DRAFT_1558922 [Mycena metata]|uniref:Uncharacterized protein n=1 Tax=Mycena metata TaxID=1033252 RepID=A0AAD7IKD9_9AGAR|nr:hypothetical protein B0H16DRAFT_1558922 [Mycena metata]